MRVPPQDHEGRRSENYLSPFPSSHFIDKKEKDFPFPSPPSCLVLALNRKYRPESMSNVDPSPFFRGRSVLLSSLLGFQPYVRIPQIHRTFPSSLFSSENRII